MSKIMVSIVTMLVTLLVVAGVGLGIFWQVKYAPSTEEADLSSWFQVSGQDVAVVLEDELLEDITGIYEDERIYLPLTWVNEVLNDRFYWDESEKQLIYALPESVVYADTETKGTDGKALLIEQDDTVWLSVNLILAYTDVRMDGFELDEVKRIFINMEWEDQAIATTKKDTQVRLLGGVKSPVITQVEKKSDVVILDVMEEWSKVRTQDGYIGYILNKTLENKRVEPQISEFKAPVYTNITVEEPITLVWHQVTNFESNKGMEALMDQTSGVNVIAPTWIMLTDNEGNYDSLAESWYVEEAHSRGLQVWAVLDNFNRGDNVQSEILFANTKARATLIQSLMGEAKIYGFDGINVDVEGIKPEAGPHFVQFMRELSIACREAGIILSVDTYVPSQYTEFYNRKELGVVTDYVIMMGYDEHYAGGDMGSVASLGYVKTGLEKMLDVIPNEKVMNAVPFYTRVWKVEDESLTSSAWGISKTKQWIKENEVELYWQEEMGQYYGELETESISYYVWMEEEESIGKKMELVTEFDLAGVAAWKLGLESEEIWEVMKQ